MFPPSLILRNSDFFCGIVSIFMYLNKMICMYSVSFKVRKATVFQSFCQGSLSLVFNPGISEFIMGINFVPVFQF